jgi:hypothetical protein
MMLVFWVVATSILADTNVSDKHNASTFSPKDGDSMFLRKVGIYLRVHTASEDGNSMSLRNVGICLRAYTA